MAGSMCVSSYFIFKANSTITYLTKSQNQNIKSRTKDSSTVYEFKY